jgi:hypothetical protein
VTRDKNIPTEEEFEKASEALRKRSYGLSEIRDEILKKFKEQNIYEFFIFDVSEKSFKAYVFFRWDWQRKELSKTKIAGEIEDFIYQQLENFGRGKKVDLQLEIEFDSHENVELKYDGDYFSRLR